MTNIKLVVLVKGNFTKFPTIQTKIFCHVIVFIIPATHIKVKCQKNICVQIKDFFSYKLLYSQDFKISATLKKFQMAFLKIRFYGTLFCSPMI